MKIIFHSHAHTHIQTPTGLDLLSLSFAVNQTVKTKRNIWYKKPPHVKYDFWTTKNPRQIWFVNAKYFIGNSVPWYLRSFISSSAREREIKYLNISQIGIVSPCSLAGWLTLDKGEKDLTDLNYVDWERETDTARFFDVGWRSKPQQQHKLSTHSLIINSLLVMCGDIPLVQVSDNPR